LIVHDGETGLLPLLETVKRTPIVAGSMTAVPSTRCGFESRSPLTS
jgi:hypothetical protein